MLKTKLIRTLTLTALNVTALVVPALALAQEPPPASIPVATPATATMANMPYPDRIDPFKMPSDKTALATRRESVAANLDLKLKGFVKVGELKAVLQLSGEVVILGAGERRGEIKVVEIAPPNLTLQRGRHRWTETLVDERPLAASTGK